MFLQSNPTAGVISRIGCMAMLGLVFVLASACDGDGSARTTETNPTEARTTEASSGNDTAEIQAATISAVLISDEPRTAEDISFAGDLSFEDVSFKDAQTAYAEKRYEDGVLLFKAYTSQHDQNPWGFYMLGLTAMKDAQYELAEASFTDALDLDSTHVKSWINLGRTLLDQYRAEEALVAVDHVFALDIASADAYRTRGRALHAMGRLDDAADAYRDALRINDRDVWSMNNLALIQIEQERFELALPTLARASQLSGDIPVIYNNLGMALERTYRFQDAENAYATALALDTSYTRAATNLARVEAVAQDPDVEVFDREALANRFVEEIQSWSDENIARELPLIQPAPDLEITHSETNEFEQNPVDQEWF